MVILLLLVHLRNEVQIVSLHLIIYDICIKINLRLFNVCEAPLVFSETLNANIFIILTLLYIALPTSFLL